MGRTLSDAPSTGRLRSKKGIGGLTARGKDARESHAPVLDEIIWVAVTSYALTGEEKVARAAGCYDYVPKPYSPRELLAKIRQHLS